MKKMLKISPNKFNSLFIFLAFLVATNSFSQSKGNDLAVDPILKCSATSNVFRFFAKSFKKDGTPLPAKTEDLIEVLSGEYGYLLAKKYDSIKDSESIESAVKLAANQEHSMLTKYVKSLEQKKLNDSEALSSLATYMERRLAQLKCKRGQS